MSILQVFSDVDLRNGHDGLKNVAREKRLNLDNLQDGEYVLFINAAKTKMRVFASRDIFLSYRAPSGRIQMELIREIPRAFDGKRINFDAAHKKALQKILGVKDAKQE